MKRFYLHLLSFSLFFISQFSYAQTFQKAVGTGIYDDAPEAVAQDSQGNFYITGHSTNSAFEESMLLMKVNTSGNVEWYRNYKGSIDDRMRDVIVNAKGNIVTVGKFSPYISRTYTALFELSTAGDTLWTRGYDINEGLNPMALTQASDSSYLVCGEVYISGSKYFDLSLMKVANNGDTLWTKAFGGASRDRGLDVIETSDGGYAVTGYTESFGGDEDLFIVKTDVNGNLLWDKVLEGSGTERGTSVIELSNGNLLVTGYTNSFGAGDYDVLVASLDASSGALQWAKTYGSADREYGSFLFSEKDNAITLLGTTDFDMGGNRDVYAIRMDNNGDTISTDAYGINGSQAPVGMFFSESDTAEWIFTDITLYTSGFYTFPYIIKTDQQQNSCNERASFTTINTVTSSLSTTSSGSDTLLHATYADSLFTVSDTTTTDSLLCIDCILSANISTTEITDSCDGASTVTVTEGYSPYTYQWNDDSAQTSATATGLCAGTYQVTVTDSTGCSIILYDTLSAPSANNLEGSLTNKTSSIGIFPNPSSGTLFIRGIEENSIVTVHNSIGKLMIRQQLSPTGKKQNPIEVNTLVSGWYYVTIVSPTKTRTIPVFITP